MPRPLALSRFSGASGSGSVDGVEAGAFVAHADGDAGRRLAFERRELDVHTLARVVAVAVLDRVDHRFAHGDADPVQRLVVEARQPADVIADDLHEVEHVERAVEVETDGAAFIAGQSTAGSRPVIGANGLRHRGDRACDCRAPAYCYSVGDAPIASCDGAAGRPRPRARPAARRQIDFSPLRPAGGDRRRRLDHPTGYSTGGRLRVDPAPACARSACSIEQTGRDAAGLHLRIAGRGLRGLAAPAASLDAGNSGSTMRMLAGLLAAQPLRRRDHRRRLAAARGRCGASSCRSSGWAHASTRATAGRR